QCLPSKLVLHMSTVYLAVGSLIVLFHLCPQLFSMGKISGEKVACLRASFNFLHETLRSSQESEMHLLQEAKALRTTLEQQKQELEKAELKKNKQKLYQLLYFVSKYCFIFMFKWEKHPIWSQTFGSHCIYFCCPVYPQELENRYMALKNSCEEVRKEVVQLRQEVKTLTESMETQQKHIKKEQHELENLKDLVESNVLLIPVQLGKEINRVAHKKSELEKQVAVIEQQRMEHTEHQQRMEAKCKEVKEAKREVVRELEGHKSWLVTAENIQDRLLKELQMTKEKEWKLLQKQIFCDVLHFRIAVKPFLSHVM
uniref:Uncharacterized protein n=1 Tax=Sinocyclocheilus rhinocerous TaxID=307959 RepID=A0A673H7T3_9TELE